MPLLKRTERLKRIIRTLRRDPQSMANVRLSTLAYKQGSATTLDEMEVYVRAHRPSSTHVDLRAAEAEQEHPQEMARS
jgi:hypothetical protein